MKTKNEVATEKFLAGYNCAQSVLYGYGLGLGLDGEASLKVATGLGAGMGQRLRCNTENHRKKTMQRIKDHLLRAAVLAALVSLPSSVVRAADASVDVIISNCVINLSPDKPQVWREMARVLKPEGRVAVSDLALLQPLPGSVVEMVEALVGCIAGAVLISETERMAREAGLAEIRLNPKTGYVAAMTDWRDPLYQMIIGQLPAGGGPEDYITSLEVAAVKPARKCCG
jgi:SAM-dependent methyltransferase